MNIIGDPGYYPMDVQPPVPSKPEPTIKAVPNGYGINSNSLKIHVTPTKRWAVARRSDDDIEFVLAQHVRIIDGCLHFYDQEDAYISADVVLLLAAGTWRTCAPAVGG